MGIIPYFLEDRLQLFDEFRTRLGLGHLADQADCQGPVRAEDLPIVEGDQVVQVPRVHVRMDRIAVSDVMEVEVPVVIGVEELVEGTPWQEKSEQERVERWRRIGWDVDSEGFVVSKIDPD